VFRARRVRRPRPRGTLAFPEEHPELAAVLDVLARGGIAALPERRDDLASYRDRVAAVDPDDLTPDAALAYWLNLYNAGALHLAAGAVETGRDTVLRIPGAFDAPWVTVAGETLSLNDIEHGKIRRFGDPRIHGALVCGSVSCPTLRNEPFVAGRLDDQLDNQLRSFLTAGGAVYDPHGNVLHLSRVFLWYGGDFTRPARMPTWLSARTTSLARTLARWLTADVATAVRTRTPKVRFAPYDWGLACSVTVRPEPPERA